MDSTEVELLIRRAEIAAERIEELEKEVSLLTKKMQRLETYSLPRHRYIPNAPYAS